ncbi:hypothetical protein N7474_008153 [Penicillium riverlandense]|uniref:uncharacterized protein n=1 Tax=Penicillium riverlandense TaxID=1903569 RepID=UPI0025476E18|nr:uncharacterized protein N7474_008153 [Penicillium riverlandense]KAJ5811852.1 hypothetical protein N7474_008153 [Penicillium riverlandense]
MEQAGKRLLPKVVDDFAETDPERRFAIISRGAELSDGFQTLSMKDVSRAVNILCEWMESTIKPARSRETLAYMGKNDVRYCFFLLACQKLGFQAFFPSTRNSDEVHVHLLKATRCTKFFCSEGQRSRALETQCLSPDVDVFEVPTLKAMLSDGGGFRSYPSPNSFAEACDEPVCIIHSSGTTGMPKPVYLTNGFFGTMDAVTQLQWPPGREPSLFFNFDQQDLVLTTTPFFHLMGLMAFVLSIFHGAPALIGPEKPPSVDFLVELMRKGRPTAAVYPPSLLEDLSHSDEALACLNELRTVRFGGAPLAPETGERLRKYTQVVTAIGSSEAGWIPSMVPEDPGNWNYFEWHPEYGLEMQPTGNDLYEMVLRRQASREFHGIFHTFPNIDTYRTNDLFTQHPTVPSLWKFYGRGDDVIVLSNGEKFNPVTMETIMEGHPLVSRAVVIGEFRFQAGLLIEPAVDVPEMDTKMFIEQIWPAVQAANMTIAAHGRVMKSKIGLASKTMPFKRTPKGTTQRRAVLRDYMKEIDAIYSDGLEEEPKYSLPDTLDQASVRRYVRQTMAHVLGTSDIPIDQDFYSAGLDSLLTIQASRVIKEGIQLRRPDIKAGLRLMTPQTIYGNPTVEKLSRVVRAILKDNMQQTGIPRAKKIQDLVKKYTADLPLRDERFLQSNKEAHFTMILTGSTGSLGTYLLYNFLCSPVVSKIYCLNRSDAEPRQRKSFEEKGLHVEEDDWKNKLEFLTVSFGKPRFYLDEAKYQELLESVDTIIHNAWKVDFNHSVDSFEADHICGVRRFIDFGLHSKHNAHLHFVSSISTVGAWTPNMAPAVPEVPIENSAVVLPQGYGESKYVAERICLEASRRCRMETTIYRVGQIAGPTTASGQWNQHEWIPAIIATSKALGQVPNWLGGREVDWIPVDTLSSIMGEIVNTQSTNPSEDLCSVFHLTNPSRVPWSSLIPIIQKKYAVEPVELAAWIGKLENIRNPTDTEVRKKPALKLLGFYRALLDKTSALSVVLDVRRAQEASATMRSLGPISVHLMLNWLQQWQF